MQCSGNGYAWVDKDAVRSKAVILLLLSSCPHCFGFFYVWSFFVLQYLVSFLVLQSFHGGRDSRLVYLKLSSCCHVVAVVPLGG